MIQIKLDREIVKTYNQMKRKEYKDRIELIEKEFFKKYSEHFVDDGAAWLAQHIWPSVKYTIQCQMGVIKKKDVDQNRLMMGMICFNDLINEYGAFEID